MSLKDITMVYHVLANIFYIFTFKGYRSSKVYDKFHSYQMTFIQKFSTTLIVNNQDVGWMKSSSS